MTVSDQCDECGAPIAGDDLQSFGDAYIAHIRGAHPDWPYPDLAIRNYAEASQRLTGSTERLPTIGSIDIQPVTESRIEDWLKFFDHDAFAGNKAWASCYCSEPHVVERGTAPDDVEPRGWRENRELMIDLLRTGQSSGYLAYVDGRPAGWVNASKRSCYALYRLGGAADPPDDAVVGISCFVISPPHRRHGIARALLDRVLADAPARGVRAVEAYPFNHARDDAAGNFRGPRSLYDAYGFVPVEQRARDTVVRRTL